MPLLLAVLAPAVLAGCSGAGMAPEALRGTGVQALAMDHMTAVQLLRSWLAVMYPEVATPGTPNLTVEQVDADTWHAYGTDSTGQALDYYSNDDGSGYGYWHSAPGVRVDGTWTAYVWTSETVMWQDIVYQYPDLRMSFRATCDYAPSGGNGFASVLEEGTASNAQGQQLTFRWFNNGVDQDHIHVDLPAAQMSIDLAVATAFVVNQGFRPAPGQPAVGTMRAPDGVSRLTLEGDDNHWRHWALAAPDGTTGDFSLGSGMSGSGTFMRNGVLQGALNWTATMTGRLDMATVGTVEVTPAAAARDLAIEKWLSSIAGLSPGAIQ